MSTVVNALSSYEKKVEENISRRKELRQKVKEVKALTKEERALIDTLLSQGLTP